MPIIHFSPLPPAIPPGGEPELPQRQQAILAHRIVRELSNMAGSLERGALISPAEARDIVMAGCLTYMRESLRQRPDGVLKACELIVKLPLEVAGEPVSEENLCAPRQ